MKSFFFAICSFGIAEACLGMDCNPLTESSLSQGGVIKEVCDPEESHVCVSDLCSEITEKDAKTLVESLSRIVLGTATIVGTTLIGVGFLQAFRKAKAQADSEWSFPDKIEWQNWRRGISLRKAYSCGISIIFSRYYFVPGAISLIQKGKSIVSEGYRLGKTQICRGVQDLRNLHITLSVER